MIVSNGEMYLSYLINLGRVRDPISCIQSHLIFQVESFIITSGWEIGNSNCPAILSLQRIPLKNPVFQCDNYPYLCKGKSFNQSSNL